MAARDYGQYSGITRAMELVGERWAMLIHQLEGPRDAAVLPVIAYGHRPQACWSANASGPCPAAAWSM